MSKHKHTFPITALIIAAILWGANTVFIKIGVESIPVPVFMSMRFLAVGLILLPFAIRTWKPLKQKDFLLLCLSSLFYITFSVTALNIGLTKTTAINTSIIWLLSPLLLFILSTSFLKERINIRTFVSICIALAGALVIIGEPWSLHSGNMEEIVGNLLIVISVFCNVISTIICKPIAKRVGSYQLTFMNFAPGIVPILLYSITQLRKLEIDTITSASWNALVASIIAVIIANLLFFYALRYKDASEVGIYQYLDTVATIVVAYFLLSETPTAKFALGAILVCAGVYVAEFYQSSKLRKLLYKNTGNNH